LQFEVAQSVILPETQGQPPAKRARLTSKIKKPNSNQPLLPAGTRVEVEFEDDEVGQCWFDGTVESQSATGSVVHFDDGDVQDLDLHSIAYGILQLPVKHHSTNLQV
jgi:hypothetical protein